MLRRLVSVALGILALLSPLGTPAMAEGTSDLALVETHHPDGPVAVWTKIRIVAVAANLGPDDLVNDSLDITYDHVRHLRVLRQRCSDGVSADTPSCEFGEVVAGGRVQTIIIAQVRAWTFPAFAHIRFCVSHEAAIDPDPDHSNDCRSVRVEVSG
jgi:hypothetical protein